MPSERAAYSINLDIESLRKNTASRSDYTENACRFFHPLFAVAVGAGAAAGDERVTAGALFGLGLCFVGVDVDPVECAEVFRFCVICAGNYVTFNATVYIIVIHKKSPSVFGLHILFPKTEGILFLIYGKIFKNQRYSMLFLTVLYFS